MYKNLPENLYSRVKVACKVDHSVPDFWEFRNLWIIESSNMLYVCYMFEQHITCFKASGYRGLRPVMLYGYMFLQNSFLSCRHYLLRSPRLRGSEDRLRGAWQYSPRVLGISPIPP